MKQYLGMQFLQNSTFMKYPYKRKTPAASFRSGRGFTIYLIYPGNPGVP